MGSPWGCHQGSVDQRLQWELMILMKSAKEEISASSLQMGGRHPQKSGEPWGSSFPWGSVVAAVTASLWGEPPRPATPHHRTTTVTAAWTSWKTGELPCCNVKNHPTLQAERAATLAALCEHRVVNSGNTHNFEVPARNVLRAGVPIRALNLAVLPHSLCCLCIFP